ncbi:hypothetical protein DXG01_000487, partial [Tephrocybe rancida]
MSPDVPLIPYLLPAAYPLHFRVPPLGPGMFAAPEESAIAPDVAASFRYNLPSTTIVGPLHTHGEQRNHASLVEYSGNTLDPAYAMELSDDKCIPIATIGFSNDVVPAFSMKLSDGEGADGTGTQVGPSLPSVPTTGPDACTLELLPGNDLDPAYEMDLLDDEWDPSAGLVLSDDEDVAADMELSDDEA